MNISAEKNVLNLPQSIERNLRGEIVERSIDVKAIESLPAADVAPVVRCKDCKHLDVKTAGWGICKDANGCGRLCGPNYFCSSGVRKE